MAEGNRDATICLEAVGLVRQNKQGAGAQILSDISFAARSGEISAIVGPSGGGKSSLIRLINRLDDPTSGAIYLDGADIRTMEPLQLRRRIAMVLQKPFMFEGTVLANLQRPFLYRQEPLPAAESAEIRSVLELVNLPREIAARDARTLSVGEQQRVNLARALVVQPQVILLDEPTSALDRPTADRLATTLREICRSRGLAVILVTHDLRLAEKVADNLIYLERGKIFEIGSTAELLVHPQSPELRRFLAEPEERKD